MQFLVHGIEIVNIGDIMRNIGKICFQSFFVVVDIFKIYFQYIFYFLRKIDQEMGY